MTIKKELKKAYLKLTGQYKRNLEQIQQPILLSPPADILITNILSEKDYKKNDIFIKKMHQHHFSETPKSFLCFLPYNVKKGFLSGGYSTILSINDALSRIFNAKAYLCFFPIVKDENMKLLYANAIKECFPKMDFEIVDYDQAFLLHVDFALCNFWMGAYPLLKFNNCKEKYNLIQDHEAMFYNDAVASLAEQTLSFGFYKLCNSKALQNYTTFIDKESASFRYIPGINHYLYYPRSDKEQKQNNICKIIFYGRPSTPRNAFSFLVPVLQKVKAVLKEKVRIISVGENYNLSTWNLENIVENFGLFDNLEKLAELYRQCDIGISLITTPTFSYQHLEFMASGLCLVTNKQSGIEDFLKDEENAIVSELSIDIMANKIIDLVNNPKKMQKISTNAVKTTDKLDWDKCFKSIADFIMLDKRNK